MGWRDGLREGSDEYGFVTSDAKRIRVLAGPGTGKSFCLEKRILRLLEKGVNPKDILILTFTSVAADGLRSDVQDMAKKEGIDDPNIEVSTLHSLCRKQLEEKQQLGKNASNVRVLQDFEINTMLYDLEPDRGKIGSKKELLRYYEDDLDGKGLADKSDPLAAQYDQFCESISAWFEAYGGLVPGELVLRMCRFLKSDIDVQIKPSYQYVMVDEYQDLNKSEQELVELLTAENGYLAVIGDDDQSIYEFKGGSPEGIRKFVDKYPDCETFTFSMCYRCPVNIVTMASNLIKNNEFRKDKVFEPNWEYLDGLYNVTPWDTPEKEVDGLCNLIISEINEGLTAKDIVVLTPTRARGKKMQQALLKAGIPTAICFRDSVFDNKEAREAYSILSVLAQPDDLISWRYLFGKGKVKSCYYIQKIAKEKGSSILGILDEYFDNKSDKHINRLVKRYCELKAEIEELKEVAHNNRNELIKTLYPIKEDAFSNILWKAIEENFGLTDKWLKAVCSSILKNIYFSEVKSNPKQVRVLSLHAAKGLSAPVVVIMSAIDDLLPITKSPKEVEEQRRLYYVAITRCKGGKEPQKEEGPKYSGKLVVSYYTGSEEGEKKYRKSRFLEEMMY